MKSHAHVFPGWFGMRPDSSVMLPVLLTGKGAALRREFVIGNPAAMHQDEN